LQASVGLGKDLLYLAMIHCPSAPAMAPYFQVETHATTAVTQAGTAQTPAAAVTAVPNRHRSTSASTIRALPLPPAASTRRPARQSAGDPSTANSESTSMHDARLVCPTYLEPATTGFGLSRGAEAQSPRELGAGCWCFPLGYRV
jgi:hypothetical protein